MGITYSGPYADQLAEHEGYAARILPDGSETGTWTHTTREFTGYRAVCECGWRSQRVHPPTQAGEDSADADWDRLHLRTVLAAEAARHQIPAGPVLELLEELRSKATDTANGTDQVSEYGQGMLATVLRLETLLDELAEQEHPGHTVP